MRPPSPSLSLSLLIPPSLSLSLSLISLILTIQLIIPNNQAHKHTCSFHSEIRTESNLPTCYVTHSETCTLLLPCHAFRDMYPFTSLSRIPRHVPYTSLSRIPRHVPHTSLSRNPRHVPHTSLSRNPRHLPSA